MAFVYDILYGNFKSLLHKVKSEIKPNVIVIPYLIDFLVLNPFNAYSSYKWEARCETLLNYAFKNHILVVHIHRIHYDTCIYVHLIYGL